MSSSGGPDTNTTKLLEGYPPAPTGGVSSSESQDDQRGNSNRPKRQTQPHSPAYDNRRGNRGPTGKRWSQNPS